MGAYTQRNRVSQHDFVGLRHTLRLQVSGRLWPEDELTGCTRDGELTMFPQDV